MPTRMGTVRDRPKLEKETATDGHGQRLAQAEKGSAHQILRRYRSKERWLLYLLVGDVEMFVGQPRRYPAARGATEVAEL